MYDLGSVHGRFQPFHNGHLEYVLRAMDKCSHLYVGITQYQSENLVNASDLAPHRAMHSENPLTFFERLQCIRRALEDGDVQPDRYTVIPFPIEQPTSLPEFLPTTVPIFTTIYDEWNREKVRLLSRQGYEVLVLWERRNKAISGSQVRAALVDGTLESEGWVSPSVLRYLADIGLRERLKSH